MNQYILVLRMKNDCCLINTRINVKIDQDLRNALEKLIWMLTLIPISVNKESFAFSLSFCFIACTIITLESFIKYLYVRTGESCVRLWPWGPGAKIASNWTKMKSKIYYGKQSMYVCKMYAMANQRRSDESSLKLQSFVQCTLANCLIINNKVQMYVQCTVRDSFHSVDSFSDYKVTCSFVFLRVLKLMIDWS